MSRSLRFISGAAVVAFAVAAAGQPTADRVAELIEALGSADFHEREQASAALLDLPGTTLDDIETALTIDALSLEQQRRLTQAARLRFMTEPRAAMGITLGDITDLGLQIVGTTAGFDSMNALRPGDILTSIDGVEIRARTDLQIAIISNAPGVRVPVQYLREGVPGEVMLILGAWHDLPNAGSSPHPDVLALAWQHRSRDYRSLTEPTAIPTLGTPVTGAPSGLPGGSRRGIRRDKPIAGGEAREGAVHAAGVSIDRRLSPLREEREADLAGFVASSLRELEDREQQKRVQIARVDIEMQRAEDRGDEAATERYQNLREQYTLELGLVLEQIERLRQQIEDDR